MIAVVCVFAAYRKEQTGMQSRCGKVLNGFVAKCDCCCMCICRIPEGANRHAIQVWQSVMLYSCMCICRNLLSDLGGQHQKNVVAKCVKYLPHFPDQGTRGVGSARASPGRKCMAKCYLNYHVWQSVMLYTCICICRNPRLTDSEGKCRAHGKVCICHIFPIRGPVE